MGRDADQIGAESSDAQPEQRTAESDDLPLEGMTGKQPWQAPTSPHRPSGTGTGTFTGTRERSQFRDTPSSAYSTQPGRTRLRRDLARVRTPAARSNLSVAELQGIERDLYDSDPFIPQWVLGLPLAVGGIIALAPVFDNDVNGRDKPLIGAIAGFTLLQGLATSLVQTPAMRYRTSLENAGLHVSWGVGPGGVSVTGSFD